MVAKTNYLLKKKTNLLLINLKTQEEKDCYESLGQKNVIYLIISKRVGKLEDVC